MPTGPSDGYCRRVVDRIARLPNAVTTPVPAVARDGGARTTPVANTGGDAASRWC